MLRKTGSVQFLRAFLREWHSRDYYDLLETREVSEQRLIPHVAFETQCIRISTQMS
jgi:hypothetical protein